MHIIILGAGVIGVTQAYYLAKKGHKVTVFDRHENSALETSFGNAGQITPGYAMLWAAPGIPMKAIKWLFEKHAPLAIQPTLDLAQYKFLWNMYRNCTNQKFDINKSRLMRISEYSRQCLIDLRAETGIAYENRSLGITQLLRTQKQMENVNAYTKILDEFSVPYEILDQAGILAVEPGLKASAHKLLGGLRLPNDETGDCYLFTSRLTEMCESLGVQFKFNHTIENIVTDGHKIASITANGEDYSGDVFVDCLGAYTPFLLRKIGINVPIYPMKGYSLTAEIDDEEYAPVSSILDDTYKVAITRFDKRMRIGGMAEISGFNLKLNPKRRETLEFILNDLFPKAGNIKSATFWAGLRPKTPDSTPIIGATQYNNLYINAGHGTLGWTQACGSSRYLSDIISGNAPEIATEGLDISRYDS